MLSKSSILVMALCLCNISAYEDKSIAQWLTDNGYNTLVSLLKSANLYNTLNAQGNTPLTIFAPTDAAFAKVPSATLQSLQNNPTALEAVLKYHVVSGYILAPMIRDGTDKATLNGQKVLFKKFPNNTITVGGANIIKSDQIVNNGVIHSIDSVLLPVTDNIGEILLERDNQLTTLNSLLSITDLGPTLMGGDFTLFAPTDSAFSAIADLLPEFTMPNAIQLYTEILKNHLVAGVYKSSDLGDGQQLITVHGQTVTVHLASGVKIDSANVTEADIVATNGIIHMIDGVLVPTDLGL